jgi:hypothetical protein
MSNRATGEKISRQVPLSIKRLQQTRWFSFRRNIRQDCSPISMSRKIFGWLLEQDGASEQPVRTNAKLLHLTPYTFTAVQELQFLCKQDGFLTDSSKQCVVVQ